MTTAWGTLAYGLAAGISAGVAVLFLIVAMLSRRSNRLTLAFCAYGLVIAITTVLTVRMHTSSTIDEYNASFKLFGLASLLGLVTMVLLVDAFTHEIQRWALAAFGLATLFIGVLQLHLPSGLLADNVAGLRTVELFGEPFVVHNGGNSPWRWALDLYMLAVLSMIIVALARRFRRGDHAVVFLVSFGLAIGLASATYDSLVDAGIVNTTYLSPFGAMFMVIGAGGYLADRMARAETKLRGEAIRLEEIVIDRTAALMDVNDRLEYQLAQQRRSGDNLAELTEEFEASNAMVRSTPDQVEMILKHLLGRLGSITAASGVELQILDTGSTVIVPKTIVWDNPDQPHSGSDEPHTLREQVAIAGQVIGELVAHFDAAASLEERRYLDLTAEHLAGLVTRLELVAKIADSAIEGERHRIAMDLHDSVTQHLYSVSFLADAAIHMVTDDDTQLAETVERLRELVLSSITELRSLLFEMQPPALHDAELRNLLETLATSMTSSSGVDVDVSAEPMPTLPPDAKLEFYRIAQEAVSNACRHSGGDAVSVAVNDDDGVTSLVITDDGVGFSPGGVHPGSGLANIEARAAALGATLDITSTPGTGTTVTTRLAKRQESFSSADHGRED